MSRQTRHNSAFTLLEMLLALALMGILATVLYSSFRAGFRARSRAEAAIDPVRRSTLALESMRKDVESALPPTGILAGAFLGGDAVSAASGKDSDALSFFAAAEDSAGAAVRKVEFALAATGDANGQVLVRRITANILSPKVQVPAEEVLCRDVISLNLRYFDGYEWQDSWDSTARGNALPLAVEAQLAIATAGARQTMEPGYQIIRIFVLPCGAQPSGASETGEQTALPD